MIWRIEKGEKMEWNGMRRMVFPNGGSNINQTQERVEIVVLLSKQFIKLFKLKTKKTTLSLCLG